MIGKLTGALATPIGMKVAAIGLGAVLVAGGTWHWMSVRAAREEGKAQGETAGREQARQAIDATAEVQRKEVKAERASADEARDQAAVERAATERARQTMRAELQRTLGALGADLKGRTDAVMSVPATELDDALRRALVELRTGTGATDRAREAGAARPTP